MTKRKTKTFVLPKRKKIKKDALQKRIEMVVKKALKYQGRTDYDVIRHANFRLRLTNSHKVG